jgi:hypothetical protein
MLSLFPCLLVYRFFQEAAMRFFNTAGPCNPNDHYM